MCVIRTHGSLRDHAVGGSIQKAVERMSPADMTSVHETFDDRLIECVRQNTVIWDPARKSCQDRVLRDNVWKEIAEKLNRSGEFALI